MCTNQSTPRCMPAFGSSISLLSYTTTLNNSSFSPMKAFSEGHSSSSTGGGTSSVPAVSSSSSAGASTSISASGNHSSSMASMGLVLANGPQSTSSSLLSQLPASTLDQYRLQLYNYAFSERLRYAHPAFLASPFGQGSSPAHPAAAAAAAAATAAALGHLSRGPHDLSPFFLSYASKFDPRLYRPQEEPKPQHSYIGLIAMAILSSADKKLVLSDIYQYILDNYAYFRTRGPGWRNSIRHNLSLNDCFIKAGRSANGKGHYWAIHPANVEDFKKGDFRRRKAQRKVRKHMGLAVDEEDSPTPPASPVPGVGSLPWAASVESLHHHHHHQQQQRQFLAGNEHSLPLLMMASQPTMPHITSLSPSVSSDEGHPQQQQQRKRLFDVASLLGRSDDRSAMIKNGRTVVDESDRRSTGGEIKSNGSSSMIDEETDEPLLSSSPSGKRVKIEFDEDVDVVSEEHEDSEDDVFPSASRQSNTAEDEEAINATASESTAVATADSLLPPSLTDGRIEVVRRLPAQSLMIPAATSTVGSMWMRSVFATPPMPAHQHHMAAAAHHHRHQQPSHRQQQQQQQQQMAQHYFNGLTLPHLPFLPATIATSMNEQLTKYYEQVAEAMRLSNGGAANSGGNGNARDHGSSKPSSP